MKKATITNIGILIVFVCFLLDFALRINAPILFRWLYGIGALFVIVGTIKYFME